MTKSPSDEAPKWICPHCGIPSGVQVYESLPSYHEATILPDGKLEVRWEDCDVDWDGNGDYKVVCVSCYRQVNMEFAN